LHLLFDGVPDDIDPQAVHDYLANLPGVQQVHDLHIWAMGTTQVAMTAHLVMPDGQTDNFFLQGISETLHERFDITHSTIQVTRQPVQTKCSSWTLHFPRSM
jgi:cobalt-zinc-cadmium efflux system protein